VLRLLKNKKKIADNNKTIEINLTTAGLIEIRSEDTIIFVILRLFVSFAKCYWWAVGVAGQSRGSKTDGV